MNTANTAMVKEYLRDYHHKIYSALEQADGSTKFKLDNWQQQNDATQVQGCTAILQGGKVFEHAGVGFSIVQGKKLPPAASARNPNLAGCSFEAVGVSLIVHPHNPYIPTTHANIRLFVANQDQQTTAHTAAQTTAHTAAAAQNNFKSGNITKNLLPSWWFGGGFDLTPFYPFAEDCEHWHTVAHNLCQPFGLWVYPRFKTWCDEYFYLPHRQETRGIGGLFFDDLNCWSFTKCFAFLQAVGQGFLNGYLPIVEKRLHLPFSQRERDFQLYRRGRYVEFNLLYDRGTLFGLQSGGRTESILMSLPPEVNWRYNWQPEPGSQEALLHTEFLKPREWVAQPC